MRRAAGKDLQRGNSGSITAERDEYIVLLTLRREVLAEFVIS